MRDRQQYSASSLSDGTLRSLALAVIAGDPNSSGLLCMEEPENGIHPLRIPEMLRLVRSLSDADADDSGWEDRTALRQVIVNTHSPLVVAELPDGELLMAESVRSGAASLVRFKPLGATWRLPASAAPGAVTRGELVAYLSGPSNVPRSTGGGPRLVRHRVDTTSDMFPVPHE